MSRPRSGATAAVVLVAALAAPSARQPAQASPMGALAPFGVGSEPVDTFDQSGRCRAATGGGGGVDPCPPLLDAVAQSIGGSFKPSSLLRPGSTVLDIHVDVEPDSTDWPPLGLIPMIDGFTPDNGATRFIPGSHG